MPGIADVLADRLLDRSVDLARLEAGQRRAIVRLLAAMEQQLVRTLQQRDPTAPRLTAFRQRRLETLLSDVRAIIRQQYRQVNQQHAASLVEIGIAEGIGTATTVNATVGADLLTSGLSEARFTAVLDDVLIQGAPAQEWWSRQAGTILQRFSDEMRQGILLNEPLSQLIRRTRTVTAVAQRHAESLVRTSMQSVANAARSHVYEANQDVLHGQQWITTLDTRACPICQALSGTVFDFAGRVLEGKPGRFPGPPPIHFQCRCVLIPIVQAFESLRRTRGARLRRQLDALVSGRRQALDGDIAADLTFEQWLGTKSERMQRTILGRQRFELWRARRISLTQLTDQNHRPLTLSQLRERTEAA